MNPDLFITITFSTFVFFVGVAGALVVTVAVIGGRPRADASLSPPSEGVAPRAADLETRQRQGPARLKP